MAARSTLVSSALILLVTAAMCIAAIVTVGRQAAAEASVAQELAGPAARTLEVVDTSGSGMLTASVVRTLQGLDTAGAVVARQTPQDAYSGALGRGSDPVAVTGVLGDLDQALEITQGRMPGAGEVIIPQPMVQSLHLAEPIGFLEAADGTQWSIVGAFLPREPFVDLQDTAVTVPAIHSDTVVQQIQVLSQDAASTRPMVSAAVAVVAADPQKIQVLTPTAMSEGSQNVSGQMAGLGRSLLLLILGAGAFFVAVVVFSDVLIRRRDLGRRRTLGITRADLIGLVAIRTTAPALIGAVLGVLAGRMVLGEQAGALSWEFTGAVAVLAAATALASSLPAAMFAASRDPVQIMRTA